MTEFLLNRLRTWDDVLTNILSGKKIVASARASGFPVDDFMKTFTRMHAGFFTPYEPQTLVILPEYDHLPSAPFGNSKIHPVPVALHDQAQALINSAIDAGNDVLPFEVLGMDQRRRSDLFYHGAPQLPGDRALVLTPGGVQSLWEANRVLIERLADPHVIRRQPLIIQDAAFWAEYIGDAEEFDKAFAGKSVYLSSDPAETSGLLSALDFGMKTSPRELRALAREVPQLSNPVFCLCDDRQEKAG